MPSGKNCEITDDYQELSGLIGDLSRLRINDSGDNLSNHAGNASDNQLAVPGNHRDFPSPAPAEQISHDDCASTLSAISPSQSGVDTTGVTGRNTEHVGRIMPSDSVRASGQDTSRVVSSLAMKAKKKDPWPTVEAVTDGKDIALSRWSTVPLKATSRYSGSSPAFVHSVIPPLPQPSNQSCTASTRNSESLHMPLSSSPYPKCNEWQLRVGRKADDFMLAEELQACEVLESEDFALATAIEAKQRSKAHQAWLQAAAAQRAIDREDEEAATLEKEAAEECVLMDKRREILNDYLHEKHVSAAAQSEVQSTQGELVSRSAKVQPLLALKGVNPQSGHAVESAWTTHTFNDYVILQRMRYQEIINGETPSVPDQNISWDNVGKPHETGPAPSWGSSVGLDKTHAGPSKTLTGRDPADNNRSHGSHVAINEQGLARKMSFRGL
ncbi:hypothetical protein B0H17DRAFT_1238214 [Mycena rosella]|uniref:Uncharacterized protein n=1 Tax=Mycena rosella TaxID=1033263 RepID=A0AAD7GAK7_MYCRO|nr:hypothetical protein B0H17DRAFT_1238214 [Mycena rosella]